MLNEKQIIFFLQKISTITRVMDIRSLASIFEQLLFSGSNLLISIIVVFNAGVKDFGIYSLIFAMTLLVNGLSTSLVHRQMVLHSSAESESSQNSFYLNSIVLSILFFVVALIITSFVLSVYFSLFNNNQHFWTFLLAAVIYSFFYNQYDICKQFLYIKNKQTYSLRCSLIWICSTVIFISLVSWLANPEYIVRLTFLGMAAGFICGLAANRYCLGVIFKTRWKGTRSVILLAKRYWQQGKFGSIGVMATWIQNQGLNPAVVLIAGPLAAGYLNIGRLFVMPITVINQGLINSSTPALRRTYRSYGAKSLLSSINKLTRINFGFAFLYIVLLVLMHSNGILDLLITNYSSFSSLVAFWAVFILVAMYRFWCGQFFIVTLDLKYILSVTLVAASFVVIGILLSLYIFENYLPILGFMIIGEVFSSLMMLQERRRRIADLPI